MTVQIGTDLRPAQRRGVDGAVDRLDQGSSHSQKAAPAVDTRYSGADEDCAVCPHG